MNLRSVGTVSDAMTVLFVGGMFALGILAYGAVPSQMTVHYAPKGTIYYGIETLPKAIGLFVVPVVGLVVISVLRGLPMIEGIDEALCPVAEYYRLGIAVTAVGLCLGQILLIALNVI